MWDWIPDDEARMMAGVFAAEDFRKSEKERLEAEAREKPSLKQRLIAEYIQNPMGRAKLASDLRTPLRRRVDYKAVGRKTFKVESLPDGALPIYDREETKETESDREPLDTSFLELPISEDEARKYYEFYYRDMYKGLGVTDELLKDERENTPKVDLKAIKERWKEERKDRWTIQLGPNWDKTPDRNGDVVSPSVLRRAIHEYNGRRAAPEALPEELELKHRIQNELQQFVGQKLTPQLHHNIKTHLMYTYRGAHSHKWQIEMDANRREVSVHYDGSPYELDPTMGISVWGTRTLHPISESPDSED